MACDRSDTATVPYLGRELHTGREQECRESGDVRNNHPMAATLRQRLRGDAL